MKLRKKILSAGFSALFILFFLSAQADDLKLSYELSFEDAQVHYADVKMNISGLDREYVDVKMAVWAPGSYLIREFSKNVESFRVVSGEEDLRSEKTGKNTWRIYTGGAEAIGITYRVYAFEMSVRTSFINSDHAYLNGTSTFMFIEGEQQLPSTIKIIPHEGWEKISTGLEADPGDPFTLFSPGYDILADSPIEIGNQEIITFTAAGVPHEVAVYGGGNYDKEKLAADFSKIIEEETAVFGENPCERYVFIVHFLPSGGGGLEHLNSTTLQFPRQALESEKGWASFLGLMAHEYFHLWNVKRLRPVALGPFDYGRENYTHMLWVAEGFTAYYDNWMVRRTGFFTPEEYLEEVAGTIGTVENTPGNRVQPVAEASFDAWIKYYRPNENSYNTNISYYSKGAILGMMIDMAIREHSRGKQTIDDLMKYLYERFYKELDRGYKDEEFQEAVERFAGDMDDFFEKYVRGTDPVPYNDFLSTAGLKLVKSQPYLQQAYLGASLENTGDNLVVTRVVRGTAAYEYGINVNDVILSIDGERATGPDHLLQGKDPGDKISVKVLREGRERSIDVVLGANENASFRFEKLPDPGGRQQANYKDWLAL